MTDITMTILVLTVSITVLSIMGYKLTEEIRKYRRLVAEAEAREARRQEALAARKKLAARG